MKGYTYQARVGLTGKRFTLEVPRPLESGAKVKNDDIAYRVAYVYKNGKPSVILVGLVTRGRPRKKRA